MPRILHLSDLHFGDELLSWRHLRSEGQWASKQLIGWLNHRFNRSRQFQAQAKTDLITELSSQDWDLCVITGDLVHLGTEAEFRLARQVLEPLIKKGPVLLTAGNHDRYTPATLGRLEQAFGDCHPFDQPVPRVLEGLGDWGFLELPMALPTTLGAKGRFLGELGPYTDLITARQGKPLVLYGHYPLFHLPERPESFAHRLWAGAEVKKLTQLPGVRAYLHGHIHHSWAFQPAGTELWSVCAGSSLKEGYWFLELTDSSVRPSRWLPPL